MSRVDDRCNHTSVGVIAERDGLILLFDRQKFPLAKAPCAGHVDELNGIPTGRNGVEERVYRDAGVRELEEETGLLVRSDHLSLILTATMPNRCRRDTVDGGNHWHLWRIYRASIGPRQQARGNTAESANLSWYTPAEVRALSDLEDVWRDFLKAASVI